MPEQPPERPPRLSDEEVARYAEEPDIVGHHGLLRIAGRLAREVQEHRAAAVPSPRAQGATNTAPAVPTGEGADPAEEPWRFGARVRQASARYGESMSAPHADAIAERLRDLGYQLVPPGSRVIDLSNPQAMAPMTAPDGTVLRFVRDGEVWLGGAAFALEPLGDMPEDPAWRSSFRLRPVGSETEGQPS